MNEAAVAIPQRSSVITGLLSYVPCSCSNGSISLDGVPFYSIYWRDCASCEREMEMLEGEWRFLNAESKSYSLSLL